MVRGLRPRMEPEEFRNRDAKLATVRALDFWELPFLRGYKGVI